MDTIKKKTIEIATHSGSFHCDEVLACTMLKTLDKYKNARIIRTRDAKVYEKSDIVVDVGGIYDPIKMRFDHHQKKFDKSLNSLNNKYKYDIRLSSAGLIYYHFGKEVIKQINLENNNKVDDKELDLLFEKIYAEFIMEVDAIDNGIPMFDGLPKYYIRTDLSSRVSKLIPKFESTPEKFDEQFHKALNLVKNEFYELVSYYSLYWIKSINSTIEALDKRFEIDPLGRIFELSLPGSSWKEVLFDYEKKNNIEGSLKFAIFKDSDNKYRIQAVPIQEKSFISRNPLHQDWCGLVNEELSKVSGIPGCIFVHRTGFIGGNETKEGAIEMGMKSLKDQSKLD